MAFNHKNLAYPILHISGELPDEQACHYYNELEKDLAWMHRENTPRKEYWTNTENRNYSYAAFGGMREYVSDVSHWIIDYLANIHLKHYLGIEYVKYGCFLNLYESNRDCLGWHADDDPGIDHSMPIVVVTLYKNRPKTNRWRYLEVMPIGGTKEDVKPYSLLNGSVTIMMPGMQSTHYHRIPKAGYEVEPRISLTYRALI